MNKEKYFLFFIFILSFFIRFLFTWQYPPLLWDEAALGYNAYSILHTGRDEYGQIFPLIFKSFGDYKPGLYVYLVLPFVALFGLNDLSVRIPSVLVGSVTPLLLFFLIRKLDPKNIKLAYTSAIILAFNPYNIYFSKGAWETNLLTAEIVLAALLFFKQRYILSSLLFASTLYSYQAGKMLSVLIILILFYINRSFLKKQTSLLFFSFCLPLALLSLPVVFGLLFNSNADRLKVISLFSYPRPDSEVQQIIHESNLTDYYLFHNQLIFFFRNFLNRYFNHLSPRFLAFEGDWQNPRHSAPYIGVILYPSLIFLFIGLFSKAPGSLFFLLWLLLAPVLSAFTRDSVQIVRSHSMSIPLAYFISLGIYRFLKRYPSITVYGLLITVYFLSFIYYSDLYYQHLVKISPQPLLYGYKQAVEYLIAQQSRFRQIYFSDFYGQPYIYYLFYSRYPPNLYQRQAKLVENIQGDAGRVEQIDNIKFTGIDFNAIKNRTGTMAIFSYEETIRQNINKSLLIPISPLGGYSTFYAYAAP